MRLLGWEAEGPACGIGAPGQRQGRAAGGMLEGCWGDAGDAAAQAAENGECRPCLEEAGSGC